MLNTVNDSSLGLDVLSSVANGLFYTCLLNGFLVSFVMPFIYLD